MKILLSKILILLMLFSIGAELSAFSFKTGNTQYVMTDTDESDKKEEVEKDKILTLYTVNFLYFKKEVIVAFSIPYTSAAFKMLPEIPPKQA
jgi:hypothetical protein